MVSRSGESRAGEELVVGAGVQVAGRLRGCAARGASRPIEKDGRGARGSGGWQEWRVEGVRGREGGGRRGATWEGLREGGAGVRVGADCSVLYTMEM
jgi:hypothetical protein